MSQHQSSMPYVMQSKIDNQNFTIDKKIIESSTLLKNICDITDITEPIVVNCPAHSLEVYIKLINNYDNSDENVHDKEFEKNLYETFTSKNKQKLIKLIQDLCVLDSDFFLDSVADYILGIFEDLKMDWTDIQKYLGLENDFTEAERKLIDKDEKLEYFLSIDTETFKFPFANKNLYSLKTDFSTPMNVLIARIIQRSNAKISYLLSLINKAIKNEIDRHPIKLTTFNGRTTHWYIYIYFKELKRNFTFNLTFKDYDEKYFNVLKRRKIIAEDFSIDFNGQKIEHDYFECNSMDFPISKSVTVSFSKTYKSIYQFDITKYYSTSIFYSFMSVEEERVEFDEIYNHLIAKDFSKKIRIHTADIFNFFRHQRVLAFYKKPYSSKFYKTVMPDRGEMNQGFKDFVMTYMNDDGIVQSSNTILGIPNQIAKEKGYYNYPVLVFKKFLEYVY